MTSDFLASSTAVFLSYRSLGERAIAQVSDEALNRQEDEECNSIATIVKHLHGNMISRWTDFLTSDGEKENRHRDNEFEVEALSRQELMNRWNAGWECLFASMSSLSSADVEREVLIRAEAHSVLEAIQRQIGHTAYHVGQIVMLAKMYRKSDWQSLTVPRGQSEQFNAQMRAKHAKN